MSFDPTCLASVMGTAFTVSTIAGAILARADLWRHR